MEDRVYNPSYFKVDTLKNRCGVYQIRCLVDNKIYVGSSKTLARRARGHFNALRGNRHENKYLQRAFNKHGENNFVFEIIEFCNSSEQFEVEQYWIDKFFGKECYNMCKEAIKPPDGTGRKVVISEAQRRHMSELMKKRYRENPQLRLYMSSIARGNTNNKASRPVVCLETRKEYPSIAEAARQTGVSRNGISDCCLKRGHVTGDTHWRYRDEYEKLTEEDIKHILITDHSSTAIICLETKETFTSLDNAAKKLNLCNSSPLTSCCRGRVHSIKGLHWAYYEDYLKMSPKEIEDRMNLKVGSSNAVYCVETGQLFKSLTKAGKALGISRDKIAACCKGTCNATPQGLHFLYVKDYEGMSKEDLQKVLQKKVTKKKVPVRKVRCVESGEVFDSIAAAKKAVGMSPRDSHISACCRGKRNIAGGYHWEYVD